MAPRRRKEKRQKMGTVEAEESGEEPSARRFSKRLASHSQDSGAILKRNRINNATDSKKRTAKLTKEGRITKPKGNRRRGSAESKENIPLAEISFGCGDHFAVRLKNEALGSEEESLKSLQNRSSVNSSSSGAFAEKGSEKTRNNRKRGKGSVDELPAAARHVDHTPQKPDHRLRLSGLESEAGEEEEDGKKKIKKSVSKAKASQKAQTSLRERTSKRKAERSDTSSESESGNEDRKPRLKKSTLKSKSVRQYSSSSAARPKNVYCEESDNASQSENVAEKGAGIRRRLRKSTISPKQITKNKKTELLEDDFYIESPATDSEDLWKADDSSDESSSPSSSDSDDNWEEEDEKGKSRASRSKSTTNAPQGRRSVAANNFKFKFKDHESSSFLNKLFEDWKNEDSAKKAQKVPSDSKSVSKKKKATEDKVSKEKVHDASSSGSEEEWEDVEGGDHIVVTIKEAPPVESEESKAARELRQEILRNLRVRQVNCHKAHLLCYIAHMRIWTRALVMHGLLKALCFSMIPESLIRAAAKKFDLALAKRILQYLTSTFVHSETVHPAAGGFCHSQLGRLQELIGKKAYENDKDLASNLEDLIKPKEELEPGVEKRKATGTSRNEPKGKKAQLEKETSEGEKELNGSSMKLNDEEAKASAAEGMTESDDVAPSPPPRRSSRTKQAGAENTGVAGGKERTKQKKKMPAVKRNYWVEYWDKGAKQWICLDPWKNTINMPESIERDVTAPMHYVMAIDNLLGMRDVTFRYASGCLGAELRRLRVDAKWWDPTMKLFQSKNEARVKLEDLAIQDYLMSKPMPNTIGEFKNHPLYVLKRDLLKYEVLHPSDVKPLGQFRGMDIYPRGCVYTCQSALNWLKEARQVKDGEKPSKIVKARPNPKIPKERRVEKTNEIFGYWQTEPFKPPKPVNGRIPRNEHGNIYLYKMCMLPQDCVYLRLEGLYGIARRLGIECVTCVVGWDFHKGGNHPVIDGCAVLKKDEKRLRKEWAKEYDKKRSRADQRRRERAKRNWRRLIKGVILMKRMRAKFLGDDKRAMNFDEQFVVKDELVPKTMVDAGEPAEDDMALAWPRTNFSLPLAADNSEER